MRIAEAFGNFGVAGGPLSVEFGALPRGRHLVRSRREVRDAVVNGRDERIDEDVDAGQSQRTSWRAGDRTPLVPNLTAQGAVD